MGKESGGVCVLFYFRVSPQSLSASNKNHVENQRDPFHWLLFSETSMITCLKVKCLFVAIPGIIRSLFSQGYTGGNSLLTQGLFPLTLVQ